MTTADNAFKDFAAEWLKIPEAVREAIWDASVLESYGLRRAAARRMQAAIRPPPNNLGSDMNKPWTVTMMMDADSSDQVGAFVKATADVALAAEEAMLREMLGLWVTENDPIMVRDADGFLLGLTTADRARAGNSDLVVSVDWMTFQPHPMNKPTDSPLGPSAAQAENGSKARV